MGPPPETELMEQKNLSISAARRIREKEGVQEKAACQADVEEEVEEGQRPGGH